MVMVMQDQESTALPMYEQQLQEANTGINNLLNAIQHGILTKSTKTRLEELEAARDELENKIALEKLAKPRVSEEQVRFFLHRFRALDIAKPVHHVRRSQLHSASAGAAKAPYPLAPSSFPNRESHGGLPVWLCGGE